MATHLTICSSAQFWYCCTCTHTLSKIYPNLTFFNFSLSLVSGDSGLVFIDWIIGVRFFSSFGQSNNVFVRQTTNLWCTCNEHDHEQSDSKLMQVKHIKENERSRRKNRRKKPNITRDGRIRTDNAQNRKSTAWISCSKQNLLKCSLLWHGQKANLVALLLLMAHKNAVEFSMDFFFLFLRLFHLMKIGCPK